MNDSSASLASSQETSPIAQDFFHIQATRTETVGERSSMSFGRDDDEWLTAANAVSEEVGDGLGQVAVSTVELDDVARRPRERGTRRSTGCFERCDKMLVHAWPFSLRRSPNR